MAGKLGEKLVFFNKLDIFSKCLLNYHKQYHIINIFPLEKNISIPNSHTVFTKNVYWSVDRLDLLLLFVIKTVFLDENNKCLKNSRIEPRSFHEVSKLSWDIVDIIHGHYYGTSLWIPMRPANSHGTYKLGWSRILWLKIGNFGLLVMGDVNQVIRV